jgi:hypothetical protein
MTIKPWWFCCGRHSYLCVLDTLLHSMHVTVRTLCDAHDRHIAGVEL